MPPKAKITKLGGDVNVVTPKKSFQITAVVTCNEELQTEYCLRIACKWLDCCVTTDVLGSVEFPFKSKENTEMSENIAKYEFDCDAQLSIGSEYFKSFNENPGIFIFLIKKSSDTNASSSSSSSSVVETIPFCPVSFCYADCSSLVIEKGHIISKSEEISGITISLDILSTKPLLSDEIISKIEPLLLSIHGLRNIPVIKTRLMNNDEDVSDDDNSLNSLYIFHKFDFSDGTVRYIFGKPQLSSHDFNQRQSVGNDVDSDSDSEDLTKSFKSSLSTSDYLFDLKVCLFPSLSGMTSFKEALTCTTYKLEIYRNQLSSILFSDNICSEYYNQAKDLLPFLKPKESIKTKSTDTKKTGNNSNDNDKNTKKPSATTEISKPSSNTLVKSNFKSVIGPISASDKYLINQIFENLSSHHMIYPHGSGRFRLEQLLSDSTEIALQYTNKRKRQNHMESSLSSSTVTTAVTTDDNTHGHDTNKLFVTNPVINNKIIIEDDMDIDIRYENPLKPLPWKIPNDLSLKKFLDLEASKYLNSSSITSTTTINSKISSNQMKKNISLFEKCIEYDSQLIMTIEYHKILSSVKDGTLFNSSSTSNPSNISQNPSTELVKSPSSKPSISSKSNSVMPKTVSKSIQSSSSPSTTTTTTTTTNKEDMMKSNSNNSINNSVTAVIAEDDRLILKQSDYIRNTILVSSKLSDIQKEELARKLSITPYGRMIIVMDYDNDSLLMKINDIVHDVNSKALPNIQGTIKSYALSVNEYSDLCEGKLDLLSGVMIIDGNKRIIILEGLAYPGFSMEYIYQHISHRDVIYGPDDMNTKILYHPSILFSKRSYPKYSPDIKRIHLRYKLKKLLVKTELYSREQIDEQCYDGIDKLSSLLLVDDFYSCKKFNLFPSMESLDKLELLYGEAINRIDMTGYILENQRQQNLGLKSNHSLSATKDKDIHLSPSKNQDDQNSDQKNMNQHRENGKQKYRLAPTNSTNRIYEQYLEDRKYQPKRDYIKEQKDLSKLSYEELLLKKQYKKQKEMEFLQSLGYDTSNSNDDQNNNSNSEKKPKVYVYSIQKLNYKRKAFEHLRQKLFHGTHNHGIYTFSKEYVSQTFSYEDNDQLQAKLFAYNNNHSNGGNTDKTKWITSKGFQYPIPKSYKESLIHPKKPSERRIEELKEPWINDMIPPSGQGFRSTIIDPNQNKEIIKDINQKEKNFCTFHKSLDVFGILEQPKYEHSFELSLIGDRNGQLPRGQLLNPTEMDKQFFRSVHIGGDEHQRLLEKALQKEKEEWKSKVVVDHEDFKVDGFLVKDKVTSQTDRYTDILHDKPKKLSLQKIRDKKSNTKGYNWSYDTTPMTIMNKDEQYIDNLATVGLRVVEKEKFITARNMEPGSKQDPKDFYRFISANASAPRVVKMISNRPIPKLDHSSKECTGPKWESIW